MTISIIGCGWLGLPLGRSLVAEGHHVKGSTTRMEKIKAISEAGIEPWQVRLMPSFEADRDGFLDCEVLVVNVPPRNSGDDQGFHLKQLVALSKAAEHSGVSKVIFISSTGIYPNLNRVVTEEDASPTTTSRGGVQLMAAENVFADLLDLTTTTLRFGGLYGPERHPGRFLSGKKNLSGAANPVNMIHLDDCIGIISTLIQKGPWGEAFSACSPNHVSRKEFYESAADELGLPAPTFSDEPADYKQVSPQKLIETTGYQFKY